jgi:hypothetical protein
MIEEALQQVISGLLGRTLLRRTEKPLEFEKLTTF